jgi:O-Antigen ligase
MHSRVMSMTLTPVLALVSLLLITWPIPGTIGLRNVLAALLLVALLPSFRQIGEPHLVWPRGALWLYALLTSWIAIVIAGWGVEPALSWREYWAQWLLPGLCGLAGVLLATKVLDAGEVARGRLLRTVFMTFFGMVLLHDLLDAIYWFSTGNPPFRQAPVLYLPELFRSLLHGDDPWLVFKGQYGEKFSFVNNTFAAILFAEIIQRLIRRQRWIPVSNAMLVAGLVALWVCSYWLSFRNGNIGLMGMLVMAGLMVLIRLRHRVSFKRIAGFALAGVTFIVLMVGAFWKSDPRWERFAETLPIALDTEHHQAWISTRLEPYPRLRDGSTVDSSAYERISWIKEGAKLALDHPLGTGLNRNAFFDGIDRKFNLGGTVRGGHAHSGIVDFTIANGFPGILLWLGFLGSLAFTGWQAFRGGNLASGLLLMFLVSGFFTRSLVDSNLRDHVLQQFLFMIGVFTMLACNPDSKSIHS